MSQKGKSLLTTAAYGKKLIMQPHITLENHSIKFTYFMGSIAQKII